MLKLSLALALALGTADQGDFPDLGSKARITAPNWTVSEGETWVRVDLKHRVATLYQGAVALTAYPLVQSSATASPDAALTVDGALALLDPEDAADLKKRLVGNSRVTVGAPPAYEDQDGDGVVNTLDVLVGAKKLC